MISEAVTTKISESTSSHRCSKFLATAKVGLAHCDSFHGGGSHIFVHVYVCRHPHLVQAGDGAHPIAPGDVSDGGIQHEDGRRRPQIIFCAVSAGVLQLFLVSGLSVSGWR